MARSSYRLDMKRDDPRTLMIKMDARLTFAGRERNHAFRLEAEREIRHLDYARHLTQSTLERQQKEMYKRMEFLKNLVEENRSRRKRDEDEKKKENDSNGEGSADANGIVEKRKNKENRLRHTLPITPARRSLQDFVNSLQQCQKGGTNSMSRSLGYLSESYSGHDGMKLSLSEKRLRQLRQEMRNAKKKDIPVVPNTRESNRETGSSGELPKVVWAKTEGACDTAKDKSKVEVSKQIISLPEIAPGGKKKGDQVGKRVSLSRMIASGEITRLPGINRRRELLVSAGGGGSQQNLNLARTFYMNTSKASERDAILQPLPEQIDQNKRGIKLPANLIPMKLLEERVERNPFTGADFNPQIIRTRELLDSRKPDEMYVWLGFESEEEYMEMLKLANEELDAEVDGDVAGDDPGKLQEELAKDNSSEAEGGLGREGTEMWQRKRFSRQVSKLSAPVAMVASSFDQGTDLGENKGPSDALKKFIKAAKTICIVRQFQMNGREEQPQTS